MTGTRLGKHGLFTGDPLVFLHLQKTGGSTIHHLLMSHVPGAVFAARDASGWITSAGDGDWRGKIISGHTRASFVRKIGGRPSVVTLLREPVERLLSHFYFIKSYTRGHLDTFGSPVLSRMKEMSLSDLLGDAEISGLLRDYYTRYLDPMHDTTADPEAAPDVGRALGFLQSCDLVGVMDRLPRFASELLRRLGVEADVPIPFVNQRDKLKEQPGFEPVKMEEVTPEMHGLLRELTKHDRVLFDYASSVAP